MVHALALVGATTLQSIEWMSGGRTTAGELLDQIEEALNADE